MTIKKINAACTWLLTVLLLLHLGTMSYSMLTLWYDYKICKTLALLTAGAVAIHVGISLVILLFLNAGTDFRKYGGLNVRILIQRISGLVIVLLLHLHIKAFGFISANEELSIAAKAETLVTEIVFFGAICSHLSVSFSRSLISFGLLRTESAEKRADILARIAGIVIFVVITAALIGFIIGRTGYVG